MELLTNLWRDGQSATQISQQMDYLFTRSAILGKVQRMGLSSEEGVKPHAKYGPHWANSRRPDGYRRKPLPKSPAIAKPVLTPAEFMATIERSDAACSFAALARGMCRYPYGEPREADFAFCGRPAEGTYCAGHHRLTHQRPT